MTRLILHKDKMQEALMSFLSTLQADEIRLEFDDKHFFAEPVQGKSVLDILAEQAEDMGPEDLSLNVDHYLYGRPIRLRKRITSLILRSSAETLLLFFFHAITKFSDFPRPSLSNQVEPPATDSFSHAEFLVCFKAYKLFCFVGLYTYISTDLISL